MRTSVARPASRIAVPDFARRHLDKVVGASLLVLIGLLVLMPIGALIYGSLQTTPPSVPGGQWTLDNYLKAYASPILMDTIVNSVIIAAGVVFIAVSTGTFLAWVITRTNTPGRGLFEQLLLVVFLIPSLLSVVSWVMLLSPGRGVINASLMAVFGLDDAPFNIYSITGIIWVQGINASPLVFLIVAGAFRSMDASLEESARMSGAGFLGTLRRVTIPITRPAILSATLLMVILAVESFDVPQLLGYRERIFTFPSLIYTQIRFLDIPQYGTGSALATSLLMVSILGVYLYRRATAQENRYVTVKGRGFRNAANEIGKLKWVLCGVCVTYFVITLIIPSIILVLGSFLQYFGRFDLTIFNRMSLENYETLLSRPQLRSAVVNSLIVASICAFICVVLVAAIAFIVHRTRVRQKGMLESVAMLPVAYPATVLGLGILWAYTRVPVLIYGTLIILAVAYVTRYLPIGLRSVTGGLVQIDQELTEAARMSGASAMLAFRRVILPLLKPSLISGWIILFMIMVRETSMSLMLQSTGNPVIGTVLFDYYISGDLGTLSAFSVLFLVLILTFVAITRRLVSGRVEM